MARTADPHRRGELLDAIVDYLADNGLSTLSMRPLAESLGQSTRVLTHHFAGKEELLADALGRLDERQRDHLAHAPGMLGDGPLSVVIRDTWRWQLSPENLPLARLVHEISGLAAAGRLAGQASGLLADRVELITRAFVVRGVPAEAAAVYATMANAAYTGLQADFLTTGDHARVEAALDRLADLTDEWVAAHR